MKSISPSIYFSFQEILLKTLIACSRTILAVDKENPDHIFGYITYQPNYRDYYLCAHYIYVKQPYRKMGMAGALLDIARGSEEPDIPFDSPLFYTHLTTFSKYFTGEYNPYLLMGIQNENKSPRSSSPDIN